MSLALPLLRAGRRAFTRARRRTQAGPGPDLGATAVRSPEVSHILIEEVMPQVEKRHNVSTKRTERAVAGLSMGGADATLTGLNRFHKFAWIGSFSGA